MNTKVSIQIPTYNQQAFIKKTVESCLVQDYSNLEINIADDHSTDDTYKIVQPYLKDSRVRYFSNKYNIGRVANYRKALYEYATGEWVINLDGDDYFTDKSFISKAIEVIRNLQDDKIVVYQGNHNVNKIIKVVSTSERINEETILVDGSDYFLNFYKINHFYHCATLYKRSEALKLDFYSFNCLFTDFNSIAKLFIKGKVLLSETKVAVWSIHQGNASSTLEGKNIKNELASIANLANYAARYLPAKPVKKWHRKMKGSFFNTYIDIQTKTSQKRAVLWYMITNFNFDKHQFRQLMKAILGSVGIR